MRRLNHWRRDVPRAGTAVESIADLSRKGVKLALAQPEVPAGRYSRILIQRLAADAHFGPEYATSVLANVVTEEPNVRNVLQKVALGEVDAGFVYYSDIQVASDISVIELPDVVNVVANYTVATLKNSGRQQLTEAFIDFILSGTGQAILRDHGFVPPVPGVQSQRFNSSKGHARSNRWPVISYASFPPVAAPGSSHVDHFLSMTGCPYSAR